MQEQRQLQHPLEASGFEANQRSVFASQFLAREGGVDASALFFSREDQYCEIRGKYGHLTLDFRCEHIWTGRDGSRTTFFFYAVQTCFFVMIYYRLYYDQIEYVLKVPLN